MPYPISAVRRFWLSLIFLTAGLATTMATSIQPPSFEELVDGSGQIVRATVHSVRPYEDSYEGERIVRTEIVLNVLETIRGEAVPNVLTIRHLGGRIKDFAMEVGAMPKFEVGKEMVLFLHGEGRFICPTVGWGHGQYGVDRSAVDGVARVRRSDGRMLSSLKHVGEPMHEEDITSHSEGSSASGGMSLLDFTLSVRDRVETGRNNR